MQESVVRTWSPQQKDFLGECFSGVSSIALIAVAGAGKTTVVMEAVTSVRGQSAIMAFNRSIAQELRDRLKKKGITYKKAQAGTSHSFGWSALRKQFPDAEVYEHKVADICAQAITLQEIPLPVGVYSSTICKLVSLAKNRAIGIVCDIDDDSAYLEILEHFDLVDDDDMEKQTAGIIRAAILVLGRSNRQTNLVDFDDMIYLTLFYRVKIWQFDNVFVDEAQDTNPIRRLLARAMLKRGGRGFFVGDPFQAINGFTGADNDAMDQIKDGFGAKEMPLTVTYRCPKAVVAFANQWAPHITAHASAPEGLVSASSFEDMLKRKDLDATSAILCRNTKPLVSAAFALIRQRIACRIEGREIGEGLKKLATRWSSIKTLNALEERLEQYRKREVDKAKAARKDRRVQQVEDEVATLNVIADRCREEDKHRIDDMVAYIDNLFADNVSGILTLSTIHKSKGREWKRVYWLDRSGTCPSPFATQPWMVEQERNLCYVAATRAMEELVELQMPGAAAKKGKEKPGEKSSRAIDKLLASRSHKEAA